MSPINCSEKYLHENVLDFCDSLCTTTLAKPFLDGGRSYNGSLRSLDELRSHYCNKLVLREIVVVAFRDDTGLQRLMSDLVELIEPIPRAHILERITLISSLVAGRLGGMPLDIHRQTTEHLSEQVSKWSCNLVPLGSLRFGVCRHRALLFKLACDFFGIACRLVRGEALDAGHQVSHAWNIVKSTTGSGSTQFWLVDSMFYPGAPVPISDTAALGRNYRRHLRVQKPDGQLESLVNGTFGATSITEDLLL